MSVQFLTNITEQEFRQFLRDAVNEALRDRPGRLVDQPPEIIDVRQAADFLKMKVTTLYDKTSRKLIPHFKKGNKVYFHLSELQRWIKQGRVKTDEEVECEAATFTLKKRAA